MSQPSDRPAPRFGPRVRTYEQRITAEFEQEIAELNLKLCERDMEIERLRGAMAEVKRGVVDSQQWGGSPRTAISRIRIANIIDEACDSGGSVTFRQNVRAEANQSAVQSSQCAASRDEERDHE